METLSSFAMGEKSNEVTSMIDLDALEAVAKEATPLPWQIIDGDIRPTNIHIAMDEFGLDSDNEYIVAACNAVPALIARLRAAEEVVKAAKEVPLPVRSKDGCQFCYVPAPMEYRVLAREDHQEDCPVPDLQDALTTYDKAMKGSND